MFGLWQWCCTFCGLKFWSHFVASGSLLVGQSSARSCFFCFPSLSQTNSYKKGTHVGVSRCLLFCMRLLSISLRAMMRLFASESWKAFFFLHWSDRLNWPCVSQPILSPETSTVRASKEAVHILFIYIYISNNNKKRFFCDWWFYLSMYFFLWLFLSFVSWALFALQ